jgi:glycosyltransferase involved in cell wall biosynthesis
MLPVALRAFDIYLYWPTDCTQSGIIAHALGAGATVACKEMEGVGDTVKTAGGLTSTNFEQLVEGVRYLVQSPELRELMARSAVACAEKYSWRKQAEQHYEVAEMLCRSKAKPAPVIPPLRLNDSKNSDAFTDISGNAFGQNH